MENSNFLQTIKLIKQKKWLIFWLTVMGAVLLFDLAVIQTPDYRAVSRVLIVQKQMANQDIYTISKSAQYLTQVLKEGIYSDSFLDKIFESPYGISKAEFPSDLKKRRKEWKKDVKVRILRDLGAMEIEVFNPNRDKVTRLSQAINAVLKEEHQLYHGGGNNVEVRILDQPLVSKRPARPNPWLNGLIGGLLGFILGLGLTLKTKKTTEESVEACSLDRSSEAYTPIQRGGF